MLPLATDSEGGQTNIAPAIFTNFVKEEFLFLSRLVHPFNISLFFSRVQSVKAATMDNLQQHYLLQLAAAQTAYLNGKIGECRDICFELRLQPDLAMYTRARLCVTICDITSVEDYANKLDIANDALRIAIELQVGELKAQFCQEMIQTLTHDRKTTIHAKTLFGTYAMQDYMRMLNEPCRVLREN